MRLLLIAAAVNGAALCGLVLAPAPAAAKIRCNGPYQIVAGSQIATPYCGDNYLAAVARGYGSSVTAREIRQNPSKKQEICNWIGYDTRVQEICAGFRDDEDGRGRN